jgi:Protein of unknown function (DUF1698)
MFNIEDRLVLKYPTPQTALDIFKGTWISKLPDDYSAYQAGDLPLFDDGRIQASIPFLGPVAGKRVLDLGPLEGAHAYTLEKLGAKHIVSIEANSLLYLKCLVLKEILGMNTHFLCGDVVEYLKKTNEVFDLCVVSGILYHMVDPVELLWLLSQRISKLIIWTHYFDEICISRNKLNSFNGITVKKFDEVEYNYHCQYYGVGAETNIYCGGVSRSSSWMTKEDILQVLNRFGYINVHIIQNDDSINGPFMLLTASKV